MRLFAGFNPLLPVVLSLLLVSLLTTPSALAQGRSAVDEINAGVTLIQSDNHAQALVHFKKALSMMPAGHEYRGLALNYAGQAQFTLGQYDAAEQSLKQSLPLVAKFQGPKTMHQVAAQISLGHIQLKHKRYDEAISRFNQAVSILNTTIDKDPVYMGQAYNSLGHAYSVKGNHPQALEAFNKALSLQEGATPQNSQLNASILNNIGLTHAKMGNLEQAVPFYRRALTAFESLYGPDHPEALTLRNVLEMVEENIRSNAAVSVRQPVTGAAGSAAPVETASLQQSQGPDPDSVAGIYSAAQAAFRQERWAESETLYRKLLDKVSGLGFNPEFMGSLNAALGQTLYFQQKYDEAGAILEEALKLQQQADAPSEESLKATVVMIGYNAYALNDYPRAETALRRVLAQTPDNDDHYAELADRLASSLYYQGKFDEAKALYNKALSAYIMRLGPQDVHARAIRVKLEELEKFERFRASGQDHYLFNSLRELQRWSDDKTEIVVLIHPGSGMDGWSDAYPEQAREAFLQWQHALDDRFRFVFTGTPEKTDIELGWSEGPLESSDVSSKMGVNETRSANYFFTQQNIVVALQGERGPREPDDIFGTLMHEIGHALGLGHSSDPADIMAAYGDFKWSTRTRPSLTERDIRTARLLYQMKPRITNPANILVTEYRAFLDEVEEARQAFNKSHYKKAYKLYRQALELYPEDPYTTYFCAISAFEEKEYDEAIALLEQVRFPAHEDRYSINKYLGYAYVELGHKYNKWGKRNKQLSREYYREGIKYLEKALVNPSLDHNQKRAIADKISEGVQRRRPMERDPYYQIPIWIRM